MGDIHDMLAEEFGRCAPGLDDDEDVQLVYLPGGHYAVCVALSSPMSVTIRKKIGCPRFESPGLADFLLRDHASWMFGRYERVDDTLVVEYSMPTAGLTADGLGHAVLAVHGCAWAAERTLVAAGVLELDGGDDSPYEFD